MSGERRTKCSICEEVPGPYVYIADSLDVAAIPSLTAGEELYVCRDCRILYLVLHTPPGASKAVIREPIRYDR